MIRTVGLMTPVEITQYFGRQEERVVRILVPTRYRQAYEELRAMGCRLTARFQPAGKVKMTIEHEEGDFAVVVTDVGPDPVVGHLGRSRLVGEGAVQQCSCVTIGL